MNWWGFLALIAGLLFLMWLVDFALQKFGADGARGPVGLVLGAYILYVFLAGLGIHH